ncbi:amylo-alpha-1,6-glucosidase [uncultured Bacteroides sp.]|uniref:alpha-L-rhamnosidase-related protein n=1 Tax=uncultured Bacteroides sp. TaxID=162156 RepID=UPI002AA89F71|nr:amylo-alpha-1,6-glucosidase [uncultured Bacteroides sp.]
MRLIKFVLLSAAYLCIAYNAKAQDKVLYQNSAYRWLSDKMVQGSYSGTAESATKIVSNFSSVSPKDDHTNYTWIKKNDLSYYPQYTGPTLLENAIYNMGLDEMVNAVEPDLTLRTGILWPGVWTRDVSYSIFLSMSYMQPTVSRNCLLRKVDMVGRIIQDTGTGGSWPVSTDRMVWVMAAWEIYKVTGDYDWVRSIYPAIKKSVETDFLTVYDKETGLAMGESSFIDWREQSYPKWMQPADIYKSKCLGTNAIHFRALDVLSKMAKVLNKQDDYIRYSQKAESLKAAINKYLWMPDKGYYAQYLYGRNSNILSPHSETLGEALCILFDIASPEQQKLIVQKMPVLPFGPSIFYPQISDMFSYHNNATWPFVTSFWMLAAAKVGNMQAVEHALGSAYRAAALFATNKENFDVQSGDWTGTNTNSGNMLWSLSGNLSIVYRLYFGMKFEEDRLAFSPFVPKELAGGRSLTNFSYRKASLNISMEGYGDRIASFTVDGKSGTPEILATTIGKHDIKIILTNSFANPESTINLTENKYALLNPDAKISGNVLSWSPIKGASSYIVLKDGVEYERQKSTSLKLKVADEGEYQVIAIGNDPMLSSFASEPLIWRKLSETVYDIEETRLGKNENITKSGEKTSTTFVTTIKIEKDGLYAIDWLYANGSSTVQDENKCCIRSLFVDGAYEGVSVFPQRGRDDWTNLGWSNSTHVSLKAGEHQIQLQYRAENENMNRDVNNAVIHKLKITRIK